MVTLQCLVAASMAVASSAAAVPTDAAWLRANGTLIFHDTFEREETGNGAKAIGNGWNSATADRVPQIKQADTEWHELVLVTDGDEMRLSVDGQLVARHRSAGFAHPLKRWFSLLVPGTVWIDDLMLWRVN